MIVISVLLLTSAFLSLMLLMLALVIGKKLLKEREKLTPFECGFDPKMTARSPFSLKFFLITIIFLIFDVEIALLLPLGLIYYTLNISSFCITAMIITFILMLGLIHEWNQGALKWIM